ncbi:MULTISPECIES: hypothetical protein [unclassified Kocuria]|uniref:hypothetical protein n=1 Tax=unclassified Kocuria TaxID=2649579 RepID=UPI000F892DAF|nr:MULTISPECIES: hypothetical protein [unclassified Kocuria]RUP83927.1 hypothetical protein D8M39_06455 [Kocuria sp. HSID17590]RUQ02672.1 hypothetical protein D8M38_12370 [Kocuria sp. HSID17582]
MRSLRPLPARPDDHDDGPPPESRYQHLDGQAVRASAAALQRRIHSRFPQRSLWEVCGELIALVDEVTEGGGISRRRIRTARTLSRLGVLVVLLVFGTAITLAALSIWADPDALGPVDWLPLLETVVNDLVFAGIAIFFLLAVPQRLERARVLRVVHRLRSLAHVIDMHQLVKVPERLPAAGVHAEDGQGTTTPPAPHGAADSGPGASDAAGSGPAGSGATVAGAVAGGGSGAASSSPGRNRREDEPALTRAQMTQYLDYCTEMLSLVGKTAALFAEDTTDGEVLDAVEGIEALTSDMARKVWQKIAIIQEQGG